MSSLAPSSAVAAPSDAASSPRPIPIRTLALVGPAAAGKTSLVEALLQQAGVIGAAGSVERGGTVSDFDAIERRMQHSLTTSVMHLQHHDTRIHLLDTPGSADFLGQSLPALEAVETAAIVINATTGVEPMALRMMAYAAERALDRIVIVNRIDAPGVKLADVLAQIQAAFGRECLPLNLPAAGGREVVDCWFAPEAQPGHEADFSSVAAAHRALVEQVVEVDGDFVERYLNDGDVATSELHAPLEQALREGHLIPVLFVSARTGAGVAQLLDVIEQLLPDPSEGNLPDFYQGEGDAARLMHAAVDPAQHVLAHVFKVAIDPYVGKMGIFRVHQGTVTANSQLYVGDGRKPFKVGHLFMLQGKDHVEVSRALPGDIVAVAKVDEIAYDAVLHDAAEDDHIHLKPLNFPLPVHGLALKPRRHGDEQRLAEVLAKLAAEDPCLRVEQVASTQETVVYGLGELHLRVLLERLRENYRVEVDTAPPRIAYRETITTSAQAQYRHKKQSGGAGQFGEVHLQVEPLPRGAGFEFVDVVKGGAIPGQYIPAVEKGVRLAMDAGVIAGHPVVDVRVTVVDGKHHSVDSKEIAFVTAGKKAFIAAMREAQPIVLEPVVDVEITATDDHIGDITGDLASRRGEVRGTDRMASGLASVRARAPLSELSGYQLRLNALTRGEGRYTLAMSHYDAVPPNVQAEMVKGYQLRDED
ncbi:small GTP-binding protein [Leptothrix cholodnii SP-6]|uniref:Elongation factor G n=1 Tax=Leptothrix cholodnii (strain ATCC 51168 / LMG 8142 / SP-6) TaxID=395495 RepID=B1Y5S7_LEPCP|nr:elongation factor G [Leptothrix cholodnii]ACB35973.1 small GTP-binding protein [Leptothrix cholodnii SP-6]